MARTPRESGSGQALRPGSRAPISGIYQRTDGEQVVSTQGHPLPPGPPGATYKAVKPAQHKK